LERLDEFSQRLQHVVTGEAAEEVDQFVYEVEQNFDQAMGDDLNVSSALAAVFGFKNFDQAMGDDLNVSSALAAVFGFIRKLNPYLSDGRISENQKKTALAAMERLDSVLNVLQCLELELDEDTCRLLETKSWDEADRLRQELLERGVKVVDTPEGTRWKRIE